MAKQIKPLTHSQVENAKAKAEPYKLRDGNGLYLLVKPDGSKGWRFDYRRPNGGKRNTLSLGTYPEVLLKRAREKHLEARTLLADGMDPSEARQAERESRATTFEAVAREWFEKQKTQWAKGHADKIIRRLERDIFPWMGERPIGAITAPELLKHLERIERRGAIETAHRALQTCGQVFRYAIRQELTERDPTYDLKGALTPWRPVNFASATTPAEITPVLRKIHDYTGGAIVRTALLLAPLLFARPGELAAMKWADLNLETGEWRYVVPKTKRAHIAALSTQAVDLLRDLQPLTGRGEFVFPGARDRKKPMSGNALLQAMRRSGISKEEMTVHGFRHMASTRLNEMGWSPDAIEAALTHRMPGVRGVYNSAQYLDERRKMAQTWADYLDDLRSGTNVVPIRRSA